jgi:hypothetical protein
MTIDDYMLVTDFPVADGRNHAVAEGYPKPSIPMHTAIEKQTAAAFSVSFATVLLDQLKQQCD